MLQKYWTKHMLAYEKLIFDYDDTNYERHEKSSEYTIKCTPKTMLCNEETRNQTRYES